MPDLTEPQLAQLIAALSPAPQAWVTAAQQLPAAGQAIDQLVERAQASVAERRAILLDLEAALENAGVPARDALVQELHARIEPDA